LKKTSAKGNVNNELQVYLEEDENNSTRQS